MTLRDESFATRAEIESTIAAVCDVQFPSNDRCVIGCSLLRASADHARAAATLVEIADTELGASVVVLARSHIDKLLRGVFFLLCASDDEVAFFIERDEMPLRVDANGKRYQLSPRVLAPLVADALELSDFRDTLIRIIDKSWRPMSSFVHGGAGLVGNYATDAEIGSNFSKEQLIPLLRFLSNGTTLAASALLRASGLSLEDQQPMLAELNQISQQRGLRIPGARTTLIGTGHETCS